MKIVQKVNVDDIHDHRLLYTVEIEPGIYVDVMHCVNQGLFYVMKEADGTQVYGDDEIALSTIKEQPLDENEIETFVKEHQFASDDL